MINIAVQLKTHVPQQVMVGQMQKHCAVFCGGINTYQAHHQVRRQQSQVSAMSFQKYAIPSFSHAVYRHTSVRTVRVKQQLHNQ